MENKQTQNQNKKRKWILMNNQTFYCYARFILVFLAIAFFVSTPASAAILGGESFNANTYGVHVSQGATHTWMSNGGWDGNGAARFTYPTTGQGYSCLRNKDFTDVDGDVYVRWVQKKSSGSCADGADMGKVLVLLRDGPENRAMVIDHSCSATWNDIIACNNIECQYQNLRPACEFSYDCPSRKVNLCNFDGEWISLEAHFNSNTGRVQLFISTQDGTSNNEDVFYTGCTDYTLEIGSGFTMIDVLGTFVGPEPAGAWFIIDDLVISDQPIGPPAGFVNASQPDTTPPAPPSGVSVI